MKNLYPMFLGKSRLGFASVVDRMRFGCEALGLVGTIRQLSKDAGDIAFLIRRSKTLSRGDKIKNVGSLKYFRQLEQRFGLPALYDSDARAERSRRKDDLGILVGQNLAGFQKIKTALCSKPILCAEMIYMLDLYDKQNSMIKSWNRYTVLEWSPAFGGEGGRRYRVKKNLADDMLKKLCFLLTSFARDNGCLLIVFENLDFSDSEDSQFNRMRNIWSMLKVVDRVDKYAASYGIAVAKFDPRGTSQRDPSNYELAVRGDYKRDAGKLSKKVSLCRRKTHGKDVADNINSDDAAADSIGLGFLSRHAIVHSLRAIKVSPDVAMIDGTDKKYLRSFLSRRGLGKYPCLVHLPGSKFWELSDAKAKDYDKNFFEKVHRKDKEEFWYHCGRFIDIDARTERAGCISESLFWGTHDRG